MPLHGTPTMIRTSPNLEGAVVLATVVHWLVLSKVRGQARDLSLQWQDGKAPLCRASLGDPIFIYNKDAFLYNKENLKN